ncbi:OLC1v1012648C1 [Oldenlandia corymbosa var. corymbosa]|uniref:Aldose 1-epimerase n=1 Tax=Oldenlandia corymbosa var. corymbosa TaxID=529605 RepID=A0AAV1DYH6_OLDCO|nr:OLC1v1012648C1 [Oldenlandia corymbosa var. corymbosa]
MASQIFTICFSILIGLVLLKDVGAYSDINVYELVKGNFSVKITNYGATVLSVILPDKNGKLDDVILGYETVDEYKTDSTYFGGLIGRVANRIGHARFKLNGVSYKLPANDHGNTLHGGSVGFNDVVWTVDEYVRDKYISLRYLSHDGEQGFPGTVDVYVMYMLVGTNRLAIKMVAKPLNRPTPINLASHTYWNLAGHNSGDILSHEIQIFGSHITPVDQKLIPTGKILNIEGTPFDFLKPRAIGSRFKEIPDGYDINYVIDYQTNKHGKLHVHKVAAVHDPTSGRKMELWSNKPGVQFYTSNMLNTTKGKNGATYNTYQAFCLETQGFPDSVNHHNFPSQVVQPGEKYKHLMIYRFTTV